MRKVFLTSGIEGAVKRKSLCSFFYYEISFVLFNTLFVISMILRDVKYAEINAINIDFF